MIGHRAVQSSITQALAVNGRGVGVVTDLARYGARNAHSSLAAHAAHKVMREPASCLGSALQHANPETPGRAAQKLFAQDVLMDAIESACNALTSSRVGGTQYSKILGSK